MAAALTEAPKFYGTDANGDPLSGGKIYTYITGTDTPKATYTNSVGNVANTNPVVLDSAGRANIWLALDALYRFEVYDEDDVLVYGPIDSLGAAVNFPTLALSSGSGLIGFSQSATYIAGTLGLKGQQTVSVKDAPFNATGDGVTDDTTAIQAAITFAIANGRRTVFLPEGTYIVSDTLTLSGANLGITLAGEMFSSLADGSTGSATIIKWTGGADDIITATNTCNNFQFLTFWNFGLAESAIHIAGAGGGREFIYNCSFSQPDPGGVAFSIAAAYHSGFRYVQFDRCEFATAPCINVAGVGTTLRVKRSVFDCDGSEPMINVTSAMDLLEIDSCTFNMQTDVHTIFDNTNSADYISQFHFHDCEIDGNAGAWTNYIAKCKQIRQFVFENNHVDQFGSNTSPPIQLTETTLVVRNITGSSIAESLAETLDSLSYVFAYETKLHGSNNGIIDSGSQSGKLITITPVITGYTFQVSAANATQGATYTNNGGTFTVSSTIAGATTLVTTSPTGVPAASGTLTKATGSGDATITFGSVAADSVCRILGNLGSPMTETYYLVATNSTSSLTFQFQSPSDTPAGFMTTGQDIVVVVSNASGGVMGAVGFDTGQFNLVGGVALVVPANGYRKMIAFNYNGSKCYEKWRSGGDIAN